MFKSGTTEEVFEKMVKCAIRDQKALYDAWYFEFGAPSQEATLAMNEAQNTIIDFIRMFKEFKVTKKI